LNADLAPQLKANVRHLRVGGTREGQVLHTAGETAQGVYFLDEGVASVSVSSEEGQEFGLSIIGSESAGRLKLILIAASPMAIKGPWRKP
jgi:CRP-like cAMP-binding protein